MFVHPNLRVLGSRLNLEFDRGAVTEADCDRSDFPPRVREETSITCDGEVFSMVL